MGRSRDMMGGTSRRTAIVADRRPLERGLARFLLEERGLFVVGEAATMADVLLQVQQLRPDIIVLHERLALDHDPTVIAQIRRVSARTSVVLLAASREALAPELLLLADTVVEDGPGLTELGAAFGPRTNTIPSRGCRRARRILRGPCAGARSRQPMVRPSAGSCRRFGHRPRVRDSPRHDDPNARVPGRRTRTLGSRMGLSRRTRIGAS